MPLLDHELVCDVVLVNVADVLDGRLTHILRNHQFDVAKPHIWIQPLGRRFLPQLGDAIRARVICGESQQQAIQRIDLRVAEIVRGDRIQQLYSGVNIVLCGTDVGDVDRRGCRR